MKFKIVKELALVVDNIVPNKYLSKVQEFLLSGAIFTDASQFLVMLAIFILLCELIFAVCISLFNFPLSVLILPLFIVPGFFTYVVVQQEKRAQEIERTAPDFLRQLSSMLQVGLSFENAMEDMSKYGEGPLYDVLSQWSVSLSRKKGIIKLHL